MSSSSIGLVLRLTSLLLMLCTCYCVEWDASNYPNPTAGDFRQCRMRTVASICDPDEVLTESQRYRLNHELHQLESRTRQDHAQSFCEKKGITAVMAIAKNIRGSSEAAVKEMANEILRKWTLDNQCQKSVVFVAATEDRRFWVARDAHVPVYAQEFTQIFKSQKQLFQQGDYSQALANIIQQTWEKAISKQGSAQAPSGPSGFSPPPSRGTPGKKHEGLLPHIPLWLWFLLIFIILPLLCCCCVCYCCCCRKGGGGGSSSSPRRQRPTSVESGGRMPMGNHNFGRGFGGGGFNNLLGSLGGVGLGHLAGQLLNGGKHRNFPSAPGYQSGGAYPAAPFQPGGSYNDSRGTGTGGKGLYPAVSVADQGGGGGW